MTAVLSEQARKPGAALNRGRSEQDVGTPPAFIHAVERRFGTIDWDLAATSANRVGDRACGREDYFGPDHPRPEYRDALKADWAELPPGVHYLNPPFADIAPWAEKCAGVRNHSEWTLMLVPASVGANWFVEHVFNQAHVIFLNGRITFVGSTQPYPKDLVLCAYGFGMSGQSTWRWRP